ncbi:MAG TPA: DNA methyltransferase [Gammaproteobacteria bacterium]|nr:DNA methyltransferase [Gammaproteobacteria bacterium]
MLDISDAQADNERTDAFIERWSPSGGAERANYQLFLAELCDLIDVPRPDPARPDNLENGYVFERSLTFTNADGGRTTNYIDLYKRGCFVCETKQGVEQTGGQDLLANIQEPTAQPYKQGHGKRGTPGWDRVMKKARGQGARYIRSLPELEGRPPFLLVVDVGYVIEIYSEFTRTGGNYTPFPDSRSHRIWLDDLRGPEIRDRLRAIWTDPLSLDPARASAAITRDIAARLARLARSLEADGHEPEQVAAFLMRCLFTMFSEDVGLLPARSFTELLESLRDEPEFLKPNLDQLWQTMNEGGLSGVLRQKLLRFNGGLFVDSNALPLSRDQLELLIESSRADWAQVEPAIFGTLLERALDTRERHKLGAHYTPREYVERLVLPTIVNPLHEDWDNAQAAAHQLVEAGDTKAAVQTIEDFLKSLTQVRVLDPACGSGNFLYVTLEHLKRLEGEVLDALESLGAGQASFETRGVTVDPHQLLGLEVNPRAVAIADIVLWIGYLQWHFRTHGNVLPPEPVLQNFHNIQHRDALIEWDRVEKVTDDNGEPVTHWDGRTTRPHPVTGKEVPDDTARLPEQRYTNPRKADWPEADFIIGNPPFIGTARMREALGDGYTEAVRETYEELPESCDFVMYWWHRAAELARAGKIRRFGFIATNSLRQTFNRRVIEPHLAAKAPLSILWAVPDHPWVDAGQGAAVRISMTVGGAGQQHGRLKTIVDEQVGSFEGRSVTFFDQTGLLHANLTTGVDVGIAEPLVANSEISNPGVKLHGSGFIVTGEHAEHLGLGAIPGLEQHIRHYRNGRDLTQKSRQVMVIDLFGLEADEVRQRYPHVYQHITEHVWPERRANKRKVRRENWWLFGETNPKLRNQLRGLSRFIATVETSKHRVFQFLDVSILPDNMVVNFALQDAWFLGVLSSQIHLAWALALGGTLEDRPRYNKTKCFETFPFPAASETQKERIRKLAEQLDAHRKKQQAEHPDLTLTGMYNVLEKLRANQPLTAKDKNIHEQGLVSVLKDLHDDLDAAVADAYGWRADLPKEALLENLVALNAKRAAEERAGKVRWLRPDYQNPGGRDKTAQAEIAAATQKQATKTTKQKLPATLPARFAAIRAALAALPDGGDVETLAAQFKGANRKTVGTVLETLAALGQVQRDGSGRYSS